MILKLTSNGSQVQESNKRNLHINSDNISHYRRGSDCTLVYIVGIHAPLQVEEPPEKIDSLIKKGKR